MRIHNKNTSRRRLSTLIMLVLFVFVILLVSIAAAGLTLHLLITAGILPSLSENGLPVLLLFLLLVSLLIGTVLAILGGDFFLRPLRSLTEATKEIASGNFDVQVEARGTTELSRLAVSFNEMARDLASIETLRSDFVSNISHEFKTPVVSIRGFARRLKKSTLTAEQREEYLDIIIAQTERLSKLSSNVLLLSRLENTQRTEEVTRFSLDEQIRKSILLLEPSLSEKALELDLDLDSVLIRADEEMTSHIWINLLSNAIKFSPGGSTIKVTLHTDAEYARVGVSDMGIGMDDETKRHIFDKFYQGDTSRASQGNGLGLSLVKRILQLCDGEIRVDSTPGQGTCFTVSLPV